MANKLIFCRLKLFSIGLWVFISLLFLSFVRYELPVEFTTLLKRAGLTFTKPAVLVNTNCIDNSAMYYEFALKHPRQKFEVRFAIRPMDSSLARYNRRKESNDILIHPNKWSESSFQATLMNISMGSTEGGFFPNISFFDSSAVHKEFNADKGATAYVPLGPEFGGKDYKHCIAVMLHKDNKGVAYVFFIADERKRIMDFMKDSFHLIRFD